MSNCFSFWKIKTIYINMDISYAVTTHNEHKELEALIPFILGNMQLNDELVILDDYSDLKTRMVLDTYVNNGNYNIKFHQRKLNGDFASHKNFMNSMCSGEWIFNIDADEIPCDFLMQNIKPLIKANPEVELFWVPRINIVNGITNEHIQRWRWRVDENNWVNWPDPQQRLYKNVPHIRWERKVHERLIGAKVDAPLPFEKDWALRHIKTIDKQEQQNELYGKIIHE